MKNLQWLIDNGGPALKLLMIDESLIDKDYYDINRLAEELLQNEKTKKAFSYFDQFEDFKNSLSINDIYGLVHGCYENCFEMFMPFFIKHGFRKGIKVFDEKIEYMHNVYTYLTDDDTKTEISPFHGIIIMLSLLKAGYYFTNIESYALKRLNDVHKVTVKQAFDIYEDDITKIRQPSKWKKFLILKDIYNPYVGENPLPIIYDVELILYLYKYIEEDAIKQKINDVMYYILDSRYQKTRGDYGWHWDYHKKIYHATTSGIKLPLYNGEELGKEEWGFLSMLDMMSQSPVMRKSEWFRKCINYLEQYKTERETYLFSDGLMSSFTFHSSNITILCNAFISKEVLPTIKRNERKAFAYELYSTFFMLSMKRKLDI